MQVLQINVTEKNSNDKIIVVYTNNFKYRAIKYLN